VPAAGKNPSKEILQRARRIKLLLMDVDGVLTDGRIYLYARPDGTAHEMKVFHAFDGAGLKLARAAGLQTGIITGRACAATSRRAREVLMEFVYQNRPLKLPAFEAILRRANVKASEVAYVGDDLPDLPVLRRVSFAIAVANAAPEVKAVAHYVTRRRGGEGAVREVVELILKAQGKWLSATAHVRA
jgi:3-deoxy-D-manno-octulosonate 8-phosphate phosphatase (KDO 8-P phosphatase)